MTTTAIIWGVVGTLVTVLIGFFWNLINSITARVKDINEDIASKHKDVSNKIESLQQKQTEHDNKFVTEPHTRDIVRSEIAPLREDVREIKKSITQVVDKVSDLVTEIRVINAVKEATKSHDQ